MENKSRNQFRTKNNAKKDYSLIVKDIGEIKLIEMIQEILGNLGNNIIKGMDDAVAFEIICNKDSSSKTLIANTDMLVSTTDVPKQMNLWQAGKKAIEMAVSDILVKGAIPKWCIVSLGIPSYLKVFGNRGFEGLIKGLKAGCKKYSIKYLGGDLNKTKEIVVAPTIIGESPLNRKCILRSGAKIGDILVSTDKFGKTGCGFQMLLHRKKANFLPSHQKRIFSQSVLSPNAPKEYGETLLKNNWATASADSSDGILKTITQICIASNVNAELFAEQLPIAEGVIEFAKYHNLCPYNLIFNAGEEFLHIYAIPPKKLTDVMNYFKLKNKPLYIFGKIIKKDTKNVEIRLKRNNKATEYKILNDMGYEHFKTDSNEIQFDLPSEKVATVKEIDELLYSVFDKNKKTAATIEEEIEKPIKEKETEKETEKIKPQIQQKKGKINDDMPHFTQFGGACGLTSLLMALKPYSRNFDSLLNAVWNSHLKEKFSKMSQMDDSHRWQITIEYLLFQYIFKDEFKKFGYEIYEKEFEEVVLPVLYNRIVSNFSKNNKNLKSLEFRISQSWLMNRVYVWKMNFELVLIVYLFGCEFKPYDKTEDGTGSICFTREELNSKLYPKNLLSEQKSSHIAQSLDPTIEKIYLIKKYVDLGGPVICCAAIHWLAIKEIIIPKNRLLKDIIVVYHDPAGGNEHSRRLINFDKSDLFYLFQFNEKLFNRNKEIIKKALKLNFEK
ncbi:MAG: thiamine-phosphate kinase [Promethearchaeota archaeon]